LLRSAFTRSDFQIGIYYISRYRNQKNRIFFFRNNKIMYTYQYIITLILTIEFCRNLKKIQASVHAVLLDLVLRKTWCIVFYKRMDCIYFTTNVCSNFFRVMKNHTFIFVKVFLQKFQFLLSLNVPSIMTDFQ